MRGCDGAKKDGSPSSRGILNPVSHFREDPPYWTLQLSKIHMLDFKEAGSFFQADL